MTNQDAINEVARVAHAVDTLLADENALVVTAALCTLLRRAIESRPDPDKPDAIRDLGENCLIVSAATIGAIAVLLPAPAKPS